VGFHFYQSAFFTKLNEGLIKQQGVRMLSAASFGFRCFTNNKKPIKTVDDLKGIKMRVQQNPLYMTMVRSMGGSPTPISWGELYSALQQGVVDGQENPLGVIYDTKFYEVQKYATVDNHVLGTNMILANEKWFQGLPADLRQILLTGAKMGAVAENGKRMFEARVTMVDALRKKGMDVYVPNPGRGRDVPQGQPGTRDGVAGEAARRWKGVDRRRRQGGQGCRGRHCPRGESVK